MNGPAILIILGTLLSASGAFWSMIQQSKNETELKINAEQLRNKTNEIIKLNKQIANSITGGNSFVYFQPSFNNDIDKGFPENLWVIHQGDYPLYDISITCVDLSQPLPNGIRKGLGDMPPYSARDTGIKILKKDNIRIDIIYSAKNGFFQQQLRIRKVDNEYKIAIRVSKQEDDSKTLYEKIQEGFPRKADGGIEW